MISIFILDNFDSFTFNLVEMIRQIGITNIVVKRNNALDNLSELDRFDRIILSPGPGIPSEAGIMPELVNNLSPTKSILGVCLGHQCIGEIFGGELHNLTRPHHGKALNTKIIEKNNLLYRGIDSDFKSARYHSWVVKKLSASLKLTATDDEGLVMGLSHTNFDVHGVQFHPESILTESGKKILENFIFGER